MASTADKFDALGYWIVGTIFLVLLAYLGSELWYQIFHVIVNFNIPPGTTGAAMSVKTQPLSMYYYGFLLACWLALTARSGFVIFSRIDYENGGYDL